jgi:hypothetical protein
MTDSIELIEPELVTEIGEYSPVAAGLAELKRKYVGVVIEVGTPSSLAYAKEARAEIRAPRYECEKIRKALKAPALAHAKLIDSEAARITAELLAIEGPWDDAIKSEEERKAALAAALELAEKEQAEKIQARITALGFDVTLVGQSSADIACAVDALEEIEISLEIFGSRAGEAQQAKLATLESLAKLQESTYAAEVQVSRVLEQQREIERVRQAQEQDAACAAAAQAAQAAVIALERATFEREKQEFQDAKDAAARAELKAKQDQLDAEVAVIRAQRAAEQKVIDDAAAAERKRLDDIASAERAEKQRIEDEKAQARILEETKCSRVRNAAPELLGTLQAILACLRSGAPISQDKLAETIERVIEQATGEPA